MKTRTTISIIAFFFTTALFGQEWKNDLLKMNQTYMEAKSFQMDVSVRTYSNETDTKPMAMYKGSAANSNGNFCSSIMGKTTIHNRECALVVDDAQKMILYKKNKTGLTNVNFFSMMNIDSALIFFGKNVDISYIGNNAEEKRIEIKYKKGPLTRMEIAIDTRTNTLKQIIYHYSDQAQMGVQSIAKVVIDYTNTTINKSIPAYLFEETKFIKVRNNTVTATPEYKKYEVINESNTQTP